MIRISYYDPVDVVTGVTVIPEVVSAHVMVVVVIAHDDIESS
jgi:hypothetical protein